MQLVPEVSIYVGIPGSVCAVREADTEVYD